jgi:processive 1,2-diacylglycerol beta-glucosyltransferase
MVGECVMDVLFLTVSTGRGHEKAAQAVKEIIEEFYPGSRTLIVDALRYTSPIADKIIIGSYLNTIRNTPSIYRKLYKMSEMGDNFYSLNKKFNKLLSGRLLNLIKEFNPSVIVTTHPFSLQMLSELKKKTDFNIPVLAIVTDYVFHSFWLHELVDAYIVAHENLKNDMVKWGISESRIFPYGIPVQQKFLEKKDKKEVRKQLGLDDKLTALIMGGSLGFGEIDTAFSNLLKCRRDLQIIVVTGENIGLLKKLSNYSANACKNVKILGYTDMVPELMDVSDFLLTKPGGLTISEALVKGIPIYIISPIPGAEEGNADFLLQNGAAVRVHY